MTESNFWQLVTATDMTCDSDTLAEQLTARLTPLTDDELAAFDKHFNLKMRDSYLWDVWGAAFVIAGCNSEFAFSEFRSWLISRGEDTFKRALKAPDTLAVLEINLNEDGLANPYLDEYDLIAGQLFEERNDTELPFVPSGQSQPKGKRFKDKPKFLKQTYPQLFERYWSTLQ